MSKLLKRVGPAFSLDRGIDVRLGRDQVTLSAEMQTLPFLFLPWSIHRLLASQCSYRSLNTCFNTLMQQTRYLAQLAVNPLITRNYACKHVKLDT